MAGQHDLKGFVIRERRKQGVSREDLRRAARGLDTTASEEQLRESVGRHRDQTSPVTGKRLSDEETRQRELD